VGLLKGECLNQCLIVQGVAGLSVGVVLVDNSGKVVWLNRTAEALLGTRLEECAGRPMAHALKSPELLAFWQDAGQEEENFFAELTVHWPKQAELKLNATRCLDHQGTEIGRALLVCDVTQERAVQVRLSQAVATRLLTLTSGHMPPEPVANLTQQELRILRLVGSGLGNNEIASKMHVSPSTIRSHLKNVYKKLKLGSRAEAVSFAIRHHLA
jgi:DNA-binding CsgD family transcriptional regulator